MDIPRKYARQKVQTLIGSSVVVESIHLYACKQLVDEIKAVQNTHSRNQKKKLYRVRGVETLRLSYLAQNPIVPVNRYIPIIMMLI